MKIRMGMVGGGPGAFIGEVHRKAARLDGRIELVAGAFDIDPAKSRAMGRELGLPQDRVYDDYKQMLATESARPADERIDFVAIVTPNNWHFPIALAFLTARFHVLCEKPMTLTLAEARTLKTAVRKSRKVFGLMHTYSGYPMVKLARDLVEQGELGPIRKVVVQYPQ
ncbi:MAG: Gfo/Idh/MocA family oxidoreductase, partial [Kiritimatiellia bacterium]|nr:Gfo/Idh/MocA family oxidoreductase [Kiritimatiellia bacterium]